MEIFGYSMAYLMNEDYFQLEMMFTTVKMVLHVNKNDGYYDFLAIVGPRRGLY